MAAAPLTPGAVRQMTSTAAGQRADASFCPVLQVINLKAVGTNPETGGDRYRAVLSDGTHYVQGMLATQLNKLVHDRALQQDSVIQVFDYMNNVVQGKTVVILLKVQVLHAAHPRVGNPVDVGSSAPVAPVPQPTPSAPLYNSTNYGATAGASATAGAAVSAPPATTSAPVAAKPYGSPSSNPYGGGGHHASSSSRYGGSYGGSFGGHGQGPVVRDPSVGETITPIASLNMYNNRWTIRARLTSKSDIRTWSNAKGEGTLFSVELLDSHGMDIRATFFREAVDKFYPMLQIGKVYRLSGGKLKVANMQYNTCQSQYEITFDQNSEIHLDHDDSDIQSQHYNFVPIADIENVPEKQMVDVLAVVRQVHDPVSLVSKKTGQELVKCDCTLVDRSQAEITLTLWGEKARRGPTELAGNPVVAFRRARVSDYGGKSLSGGDAAEVNPSHIPEAQALAEWWKAEGASTTSARSLSAGGGGGGGKMDSLSDRKTISSIKDEGLGQLGMMGGGGADHGKADWLSFKAHVTFLKKDKEGGAWYTACPNADEPCKNRFKVSSTTDGGYYCEKCQQSYGHCVRRWIFSAVVDDDTGSTWVSFFNEQAEQLLGSTADDVFKSTYESGHDQDAYESIFARANFTEWVLKCKVKSELVNEEQRVKTSVYSMSPVDYVKESKDLLAAIDKF